MKTIIEYLEKSALDYKDKIAVIDENGKYTYSELLENSKKIGTGLLEHVTPRKPVPILMEKGFDTLATFFGVVYAGAFYVLLNPELPISRLKKILEVLETNIIVTDKDHYNLAENIIKDDKILKLEELKICDIDNEKLTKIGQEALDVDPLYANFTSGSTGTPKGVLISNKAVIDFIDIFTEKFSINEDDIIANQAPFDFDVSVKDIYSSIKTGATLLIIPKKLFSVPAKLLDYICENNATTLIWAVSALCLITTFHGLDYRVPNSVNKIMFSGEVMPIKHLKQWIEHLPNAMYVNLYGPTEITCNCTYHIVDKNLPYEKNIPAGKKFDNEEVFLLDEENRLVCGTGKVGEICVKGSELALGYYNNLEQTNKNFIQNPLNNKYLDLIYKTGDLGYYDNNNNLCFSGRKDFQIKHMGHRIELEEIEMEMEKVDEIQRACCIYDEEKSRLYGFYMGNIEKKDLNNKLRNSLPIFMVPNSLIKIEQFPITKNGKIDRKELKQLHKEGRI